MNWEAALTQLGSDFKEIPLSNFGIYVAIFNQITKTEDTRETKIT